MTTTAEISTQEDWVLHRLESLYTPARLELLRSILENKTNISLRILDWFVTNYSKLNNVSYISKAGKHVIVYLCWSSNNTSFVSTWCAAQHRTAHKQSIQKQPVAHVCLFD